MFPFPRANHVQNQPMANVQLHLDMLYRRRCPCLLSLLCTHYATQTVNLNVVYKQYSRQGNREHYNVTQFNITMEAQSCCNAFIFV